MHIKIILLIAGLLIIICFPAMAYGNSQQPALPDFRCGYEAPPAETPPDPVPARRDYMSVALLASALGLGTYLVFEKRKRQWIWALMVFSLLVFGFVRKGCICPVGAIQNVAMTSSDSSCALPLVVIALFLLPLALSLFYGRIFCGSVCPLGAIQDAVLLNPLSVPRWLEVPLRTLGYLYLALAALLAAGGAGFIICRYDPFVAFFRLSSNLNALALGGVLLIAGIFIGRPYCRFLCPYGILLRQFSRLSRRNVSISPDHCIRCGLCQDSCPFGAIHKPTGRPSREKVEKRKKMMAGLILLFPLIVAAGVLLGGGSSEVLSRAHPDVRLSERIYLEEQGLVTGTTDASRAFWKDDKSPEKLYELSAGIQRWFLRGGRLAGGLIGLIVALTMMQHTVCRSFDSYRADPGDCLACGRCFEFCPRERLRRRHRQQQKNSDMPHPSGGAG